LYQNSSHHALAYGVLVIYRILRKSGVRSQYWEGSDERTFDQIDWIFVDQTVLSVLLRRFAASHKYRIGVPGVYR
jgi:hypothetical protein